MAQSALSRSKIPTEIPQLAFVSAGESAPARARGRRAAPVSVLVTGNVRVGIRGKGRAVVEVAGA